MDATPPATDVIVIGAGIIGIYQLYRLREAGLGVRLLEAGGGAGGVWYWNRYPQARFDSESYTYGYIFSKELFTDWRWSEHFAGQPEIERYVNHVVDRFDLRQHITLNARVTSTVYDDATSTWTLETENGLTARARYVVSATGGLSAPYFPDVPGRGDFRGFSCHTGLWPGGPVDFTGRRVAVVGTGPSGIQLVQATAGQAARLTVYQRTPNWVTPLNNGPLTADEHSELRENFDEVRETLLTAPSGFLHPPSGRTWDQDTPEQRQAHFEKMWRSRGFSKLTANYSDLTCNRQANADWCAFIAGKIRSIVKDPATADTLIPKDHGYNGKRPPYESGYFEAFNRPNVDLVDLKATPMTRVTETGIETTGGHRDLDIIAWATGFDFAVGALRRMGVRGRGGLVLAEHWADGPTDFLGFMAHGFPNFFFPGGPHGAGGGNYPRYASDQVDIITDTISYLHDHGDATLEAPRWAEDKWMAMIAEFAPLTGVSDQHSHYYGANIPGKPRAFLLNPGGRGKLHEMFDEVVANNYKGFISPNAQEHL
jgi:cation diffusion facilitator CzcD-associated flavoprotein CzcO